MLTLVAQDFDEWRDQARQLLARNVTPLEVGWSASAQPSLFGEAPPPPSRAGTFTVSPEFLQLARTIACHRDVRRWDLLYQLLFRLTHGEKDLLRITTDPLTHALRMMEKNIRRDAHKTKAFVRFRRVEGEEGKHYIAWHRPDHRVLPLVAPFFARRFSDMRWTILTPDQSVGWDGGKLAFGPGVDASEAPEADRLEVLWRDYYRATFNPARIKLKTMKHEMPVRHWATLPEAGIIADILAEAPARVEAMLRHSEGSAISAANFLPQNPGLDHLREAARGCEGCDLHRHATRTVFGEGPAGAPLMLVGEQPGNEEDLAGRPFVGPAGAVLDEALERAGLRRADLYITNAVKHFRFIYRESFRHHQSPSRYQMAACKPWLTAEIAAVKPQLILCLGNTAARALIQPNFVMKEGRGQFISAAPMMTATWHPAALLRMSGAPQREAQSQFQSDIQAAALFLQTQNANS